ncbi:CRISPR-associated helicase Cas3' [Oceanicella actignis]|uniref:CRISPR-associated helicase Cas3' n=1 Tax=Oceanicella actignis TaxID=1189325 RepID=UPI001478753B|nr:CRISPR-associated helicase Cas3' [Oceanicella actignis]
MVAGSTFGALCLHWPGKSADASGREHPAVLHMLDVAAVCERLAEPLRIAEGVKKALVLLSALHDLGKISDSFRAMLRDRRPQAFRHWEITEAFLFYHDGRIGEALGGSEGARRELYAAAAGHHGRPSQRILSMNRSNTGPGGEWKRMIDAAGEEALEAAGAAIEIFLGLWPDASLVDLDATAKARPLSWRLNGLLTAADWIGSNALWFPSCPPCADAQAYLDSARERARRAVAASGVATPSPSRTRLFDFSFRPMQAACAEAELPSGPMLAFIEDETGSGKTEAAMVLAQRMLLAGKGRGLYVALPTMATADSMFRRLRPILPRMFVSAPTLTLAHGRAGLTKEYRDLVLSPERMQDEAGPTEWLRDSRRRALLANVGIGTIDQALLAAVRARHATLRQYGLSDKILIVDEVHEMGDPYMGVLLETLLRLHAALGGSAILMSATVPRDLRSRLFAAFGGGARPDLDEPGYPALTVSGAAPRPVAPAGLARGALKVERLDAPERALGLLESAAREGAAAVWVRNAVDEAIEAVKALRERGVPADLLHARFALCDRKRHEAAILSAFGKDRAARPGRVLVATQVVESSLDLDFDVMISDLAPMAALIQRAGRLWRHMDRRPAAARAVARPALHVLSPDPAHVEGPGWARDLLGGGAHVYDLATLWRSASVLFNAGEIRAPEALRALIEAAHGDAPVPASLERAELRAEGRSGAAKAHAFQNRIEWDKGYRAGASGAGDADYPTRLGQPQRILVLMRPDGAPWSGGAWSVDSCQLSEVSASEARLSKLALPESAPPVALPDWLVGTRSFVTVAENGEICEGLGYEEDAGLMFT